MDFLTFKERMYPMGCFNINQVLLWEKDFDRNNLTRWCHRGLLGEPNKFILKTKKLALNFEFFPQSDYINNICGTKKSLVFCVRGSGWYI